MDDPGGQNPGTLAAPSLNDTQASTTAGQKVSSDPDTPHLRTIHGPSYPPGDEQPPFVRAISAKVGDAKAFDPRAAADADASQLSPVTTDRVFPIRSFVSVDPTPTPSVSMEKRDSYFSTFGRRTTSARRSSTGPVSPSHSSEPVQRPRGTSTSSDGRPRAENEGERSRQSSASNTASYATEIRDSRPVAQALHGYSDSVSARSESIASGPVHSSLADSPALRAIHRDEASAVDEPSALITARFQHVITEGGHAVITGRDGDVLQRCEDEPIHIPGAIQAFGLLVALQEDGDGKLVVRIVSENSKRFLGYTPQQLFNLDSFTDIMSEDQTDNLFDHIDFIKDDGTDVEENGPEVFTISIRTPEKRPQKLWCAIHINLSHPDLIVCEFELEDDPLYPLVPPHSETPEPPEDTLQSDPTEEELKESTEAMSRPLRVLRSARKRKGDAAAMEVFNIMSQVQEQLAKAPNLDIFLKVLVGVIKELTGFHRVMIYQFDQSWNGKVVTELVDPRATRDLYKGLNFPASDIPKQARDLYRINRVRLLYDRDLESARLVCRTLQDLEKPLDMSYSYLRAMSPIHVKYLANMAVRSSMSISVNAFDQLWGLISCHAYGPRGTRVSFPIRKMCRLVGDSASRNIERLSYASRLQARKLINTTSTERNPSGYIIASSEDLLKLFNADFGLLSIHDETKILGKLEATQEALAMLEYLRLRKHTSVMTSHDFRTDFPDLRYAPGFQVIAGLLHVPLSMQGNDFIVFFRKGQLTEVKWAGNPYEKFVKAGTEGFLEPRKSFKTWSETVVGKCREWSEEEIETGAVLCLVYGKFIEVWRQKEAALQNSQLTKLLLANSAHEVRTPLNAIINCLEIALEGSLDADTRENLSRSHSASKSLIYVINDLLDLTKTTEGEGIIHAEVFNLRHTFQEATEMFQGDARRKEIAFHIIEQPGVPEKVIGEQRRVRQAISNVTANAIQATTEGSVTVELSVVARRDRRVDIEISVEDTGKGMSSRKLDDLFAELEQAQSEPDYLVVEKPDKNAILSAQDQKKTLGLGLAIVARIVRNMDGQLRLKSEEGKGSRFVLQFPFELPESEMSAPALLDNPAATSVPSAEPAPAHSRRSQVSLAATNEVMLVDSRTNSRAELSFSPVLSRKNSGASQESKKSINSFKSGRSLTSNGSAKSDVDRLIEAMQEPVTGERPTMSGRSISRTGKSAFRGADRYSPTSQRDRSDSYDRLSPSRPTDVFRGAMVSLPGQQYVTDSRTPIKAVKVPDDLGSPIVDSRAANPQKSDAISDPGNDTKSEGEFSQPSILQVLVAEDDPINAKIIQRRLEKAGHKVTLTVNGEICYNTYYERPNCFDVILMDMQMPFIDGLGAAKMIRALEASAEPSHTSVESHTSMESTKRRRVPIIAVSASLLEKELDNYVAAGFDGWILKPVSFPRLQQLLAGIDNLEIRGEIVYKPGHWEQGGWFKAGIIGNTIDSGAATGT